MPRFLIWIGTGILAAAVLGWIAARLHAASFAPIGILSIGLGLALGIAMYGSATYLDVRGKRRLIVGTMATALAVVVAEHAWLYLDFRRQWHDARGSSAEVAMFRPERPWSPVKYFGGELAAGRAALWAMDAALIVAAALATAILTPRSTVKTCVASDAVKSPVPDP